jgi:phosphatidylserine decarboxylase
VTYKMIRRNFCMDLLNLYDSEGAGRISRVELTTLLDSVGSTLSDDTLSLMVCFHLIHFGFISLA